MLVIPAETSSKVCHQKTFLHIDVTLCYNHNVVAGLSSMHSGISIGGTPHNHSTLKQTFGYFYCDFLLDGYWDALFFGRTSLHAYAYYILLLNIFLKWGDSQWNPVKQWPTQHSGEKKTELPPFGTTGSLPHVVYPDPMAPDPRLVREKLPYLESRGKDHVFLWSSECLGIRDKVDRKVGKKRADYLRFF